MLFSRPVVAKYIDHTLLKPDVCSDNIKNICEEAERYGFYAVCVNPCYVSLAKSFLRNSEVKIASVVGFPLGSNLSSTKAHEAQKAVEEGADELDMVINIGALKEKKYHVVEKEIVEVAGAVGVNVLIKVIIETLLLSLEEKKAACQIINSAGAHYVKTSTGFNGGAEIEDVKLLRKEVYPNVGVKASGGIKTFKDCVSFIESGANRIGTSSGVKIMSEI